MKKMPNKRQRKKRYKKNLVELAQLAEAMHPKTLKNQAEINAWLFGDDEDDDDDTVEQKRGNENGK